MTEVLSFLYNIILIAIYASVVGSVLCLKVVGYGLGRSEYTALTGLFSFYLLDTLICFMTEYLPIFSDWYDRSFLNTPSIKTALYLGIGFFSLYFWNALNHSRFRPVQVAILLMFGLCLLGIPLMQPGRLEVWLYYLPYQVLSILLAGYALRKEPARAQDAPRSLRPSTVRFLLSATIVLSVCILIEDTIVISLVDKYADGLVSIYNRNISEDILRLVYSAALFAGLYSCARRTDSPEELPEEPAPAVAAAEEPEAPQEHPPGADEYKIIKFGRLLQLTEREMDVFTHLLAGENNQQISAALHISQGTVKAHIHNIFQKANISHRYELLRQYDAFSVHTTED